MKDKKRKNQKPIDRDQQKNPEMNSKNTSKKNNISDVFLDELKDAFTGFDKISEFKRTEIYGDKPYLEQFWEYFKKEYPNLLDKIDKKELPNYITAIEDKGFSIGNIKENAGKLNNEFTNGDIEQHVMQQSLSDLHTFCDDTKNNLPATAFSGFASFAGFDMNNHIIDTDSKLKTIDDLYFVWKKFLEKEGIVLGDSAIEKIEGILIPKYNPTERIMVTVALTKIRKELKGSLRIAFDEQFPLPISIFSPYQNLLNFKNQWGQFLLDHASEIDESLAKKLDTIIVTNGDIQKELLKSGSKFVDTKGFSEQEQYFRRVFNSFVTRQLFEEMQKTQDTIDHYVESIGDTFKKFPPYVSDILDIYPFDNKIIGAVDVSFLSDIARIDSQIVACDAKYDVASEAEKKELRKKIKTLKQEIEHRRWHAYMAFLETKNKGLADVFTQLLENNFNFSVLSADQQQFIVNFFVKHKLEDTIKNKIPELLSVDQDKLIQFMDDLFDLKKMDIKIPTDHGDVSLKFLKKEFFASARAQLTGISDLEDIKNLPLNFLAQLTESNAAFFENSPVFDSLYTHFKAKSGKEFRVNDAYKVSITKDGKTVVGYLSAYCPLDEYNIDKEERNGKELYLYSEPITSPSDTRTLVTWPHEEGKKDLPVVIKDEEQKQCDIEILDKKLNLNGEAFGALLFGYILGQQSLNVTMSPEQQDALTKKFDALEVYKDKENEEGEESEEGKGNEVESRKAGEEEKSKEKSEYEKFIDDWKKLKGYTFPEEKYKNKDNDTGGFVEGTRLFTTYGESEVAPKMEGNAWMTMEIIKIDRSKGTFTVKIHGGELSLGKNEGATKELPLNSSAFEDIKKTFGDIYKMPDPKGISMQDQIERVQSTGLAKDLDKKYLGDVKRDSGKFKFTRGDYINKEVTHFGRYEAGVGEAYDEEVAANYSLYKIQHNANNTVTLSGEFKHGDVMNRYSRDMDYPTFLIFIKEKGLQPKSEEQSKQMQTKQKIIDQETPTAKYGYSINNIMGFFKNGISKITDSIKKYDDERTEELTDSLTGNGQIWNKIGGFLSPFGRISSSFNAMGMEAFAERDNRVWKKVDKRKKFYEDGDFSKIYNMYIKPMLTGGMPIKPHYKAAAMLLAMISKGKGPYNRNPEFAAKGMRVSILMGPDHQARYLAMREKLTRELEQGASTNDGEWIDRKKNEIVELEMKYIVHTMDARQLGIQDDDKTKNYFYAKYSQNFINELDKGYGEFFKMPVEVKKDASFDFARAEFFRLLPDRAPQAISFLKTMAVKATNKGQWKIFEMAVMAGMLSGIFLTMTMSDTQGEIKKICRTRGFVPGIRVKDINQQNKLQRMLDIFSGGKFTGKTKYSVSKFSYRDMSGGTRDFVKNFPKWLEEDDNLHKLSEFFKITGKDSEEKKTLLEIYADKDTSSLDKTLIKEFLDNSNEKEESLDSDVSKNPTAVSGSILTKSQSAVKPMMQFDNAGFKGDGDQIQTMQGFFTDMKNAIPKDEKSPEEVKFYMDKFFNWFGDKGFSGENKTDLIRRLKWCQKNPGKKEDSDDILYYSIVGQICSNLGHVHIPHEFEDALLAWKDFFKNNLNTILTPDVLIHSFGGASYAQDYEKYNSQLEPREKCVNYLDRELKQISFLGMSQEQKKAVQQRQKIVTNKRIFLNADLYRVAEAFEKNCGKDNRFRNAERGYKNTPNLSQPSAKKSTGAKIKNTGVLEDLKNILENKPIQEEDQDEDFIPEYHDYSY